jgi:hypothetical protein
LKRNGRERKNLGKRKTFFLLQIYSTTKLEKINILQATTCTGTHTQKREIEGKKYDEKCIKME